MSAFSRTLRWVVPAIIAVLFAPGFTLLNAYGQTDPTFTEASCPTTATLFQTVDLYATVGEDDGGNYLFPGAGTVGYTQNGTPIAGCSAVSLMYGPPNADCQTSFTAAGGYTINMSYSGSSSYMYGPSSDSCYLSVQVITPTVTVTPSQSSVTSNQSLPVTVTVSGGNGNPTPTGSFVLSSGSYTSPAAALSGGSATIPIPAGSLAAGHDTLTATYTPDSNSSPIYSSATGTAPVTRDIGSAPPRTPTPI